MKVEDLTEVIYEKEENGICTLTFNIPKRRNALSVVTFLEIDTVLADMEKDKNARVLIITGSKEANAFSSGGYFNMKYITSVPPEIMKDVDLMDIAQKRTCMKFWNFNKPVIAAINGLAVGIGITLPLIGADLIYMSEDAWIGFYFVKRAVIPEFSSSFVLPFLVGFHKAKELMYFGDKISAHEAEKLGLVNKVLPSDDLIPYTRKQALRLVPPNSPSLSLTKMKQIMHSHYKEIASKTLDLENQALRELFETHDFRAATQSLSTKKDPIFKGK
ncbi:MAG: enoyl-CoA hydratase/isomerase family protein [Candidatus Lokiarchaeota archaeon]|nr:enoyl-CoA hydratase/isomerase family protein [Candidatus Lokiarchaeota archaeon]